MHASLLAGMSFCLPVAYWKEWKDKQANSEKGLEQPLLQQVTTAAALMSSNVLMRLVVSLHLQCDLATAWWLVSRDSLPLPCCMVVMLQRLLFSCISL